MTPARICVLLVCLLVLVAAFPRPVLAAKSDGTLEVVPAFVEVSVTKKDQEVSVPIKYINHSKNFVSLSISSIDFKQEDKTGAISFVGQQGSYSYSLSSFLSFDSDTLELGPQEEKTLLVTVKNRQDLSPGGHYAAVIARVATTENNQKTTGVTPSLSSLILVHKVGGEQFNLSLKDINWPTGDVAFSLPRSITLLFQNEGNIHLVPYGRVTISDMFGRVVADGSINAESLRVFPASERYITADMTTLMTMLPVTIASINVQGEDSLHKTTFLRRESFIYVNPVGILIIAAVFGLLVWLKRRIYAKVKTQKVNTGVIEDKTGVSSRVKRGDLKKKKRLPRHSAKQNSSQ